MAFLLGMTGETKGRKIHIANDETTIGRGADCVIPLADPSVSGHHCRIVRDGGKFTIYDLQSTNGAFVNGKRLMESRLKAKDIVRFGSLEFIFDGDDIEAPEPTVSAPVTKVISVSDDTGSTPAPSAPSQFGTRRDTWLPWVTVIAAAAILATVALIIFFLRLLAK